MSWRTALRAVARELGKGSGKADVKTYLQAEPHAAASLHYRSRMPRTVVFRIASVQMRLVVAVDGAACLADHQHAI